MKVFLIGQTKVDLFPPTGDSRHVMPGKAGGSAFEKRVRKGAGYLKQFGQDLIEFAGRLCYESWDLPNPETATQAGYIKNILDHEHFSILEHVSVTFYIEGVSRNLTHELIRHRHLSFSELSQRFVNMEDASTINPPAFRRLGLPVSQPLTEKHRDKYRMNVETLRALGLNRKQAREASRAGLPSGMETKLVVSGNLRTWLELLPKRLSPHADAEIQEFARKVTDILKKEYPDVFAGLTYEENDG
jgi:thymidylate synthase (FAD)